MISLTWYFVANSSSILSQIEFRIQDFFAVNKFSLLQPTARSARRNLPRSFYIAESVPCFIREAISKTLAQWSILGQNYLLYSIITLASYNMSFQLITFMLFTVSASNTDIEIDWRSSSFHLHIISIFQLVKTFKTFDLIPSIILTTLIFKLVLSHQKLF